jgi:hypothetical protein
MHLRTRDIHITFSLHVGEILGEEDKSSIKWGFPFGFRSRVQRMVITLKSLAFSKMYVANRKSASEAS